jgi:glycosyltransferase involved in cell wall biosynthesis
MNILCVEQCANLGGGQRSLIDLLPAFSERGWRPYVALPGEGSFSEEVRQLGYSTDHLNCSRYASIRKPARQIWQYAYELPRLAHQIDNILCKRKIELLYVNGPRLLPPASWVARRRRIPLVFHCHNRLLQSSAVILCGESLRLSQAHVIACCQHAVKPLREYVRQDRLYVIYNGVSLMNGIPLRLPTALRRIGVVGRVEAEKGQLEFVRAARFVAQELADCRFTVIGAPMFTSSEYYNKVVAASEGLPIDFIGWQSDVSRLFSNLDLLVVPSTPYEATTRVILEAYSAGLPVVAFPSGGISEIVKNNQTGFLADGFTPEALAQRIVSVLRLSAVEVNAVVMRARKTWRESHTLDFYREQICDVLACAAKGVVDRRAAL